MLSLTEILPIIFLSSHIYELSGKCELYGTWPTVIHPKIQRTFLNSVYHVSVHTYHSWWHQIDLEADTQCAHGLLKPENWTEVIIQLAESSECVWIQTALGSMYSNDNLLDMDIDTWNRWISLWHLTTCPQQPFEEDPQHVAPQQSADATIQITNCTAAIAKFIPFSASGKVCWVKVQNIRTITRLMQLASKVIWWNQIWRKTESKIHMMKYHDGNKPLFIHFCVVFCFL